MLDGFLTTDDLRTLTGYDRAGDVERCLTKQGVRFFLGKEGPWTTRELINAAGGLTPAGNDETYGGSIL
ncbi:DUF4224 domain-containing protein [Dyella sp. 2RAB6]|uniref:DUF4224 domain-containing protein n=1 Tax=Dyella sp. 2RAB6 TaxID=3232992 RepID=UPI003F901C9D